MKRRMWTPWRKFERLLEESEAWNETLRVEIAGLDETIALARGDLRIAKHESGAVIARLNSDVRSAETDVRDERNRRKEANDRYLAAKAILDRRS